MISSSYAELKENLLTKLNIDTAEYGPEYRNRYCPKLERLPSALTLLDKYHLHAYDLELVDNDRLHFTLFSDDLNNFRKYEEELFGKAFDWQGFGFPGSMSDYTRFSSE